MAVGFVSICPELYSMMIVSLEFCLLRDNVCLLSFHSTLLCVLPIIIILERTSVGFIHDLIILT
jgi:hypothetical protein